MRTDLRGRAKSLGKSINHQLLELGDVLVSIHDDGLYYGWGYTRWAEYVEDEVGVSVVASYELLSISRWKSEAKLTKAQRSELVALGRCKAALLSRLHRGASVDAWLSIAKQSTVAELRAKVYGETKSAVRHAAGFWMTSRQRKSVERAIRVAQQRHGDDLVRGDLLAHICEEYYQQERIKRGKKAA